MPQRAGEDVDGVSARAYEVLVMPQAAGTRRCRSRGGFSDHSWTRCRSERATGLVGDSHSIGGLVVLWELSLLRDGWGGGDGGIIEVFAGWDRD